MKNKNQQSKHQNKTSRTQRRVLLGAISGAGVVGAAKLPGQWTRPVVDHVLLPAHAATTDDTGAAGSGNTSASTFITTVTSNCVVTCTTGYGRYGYQTAPWTGVNSAVSSVWYTYYYTGSVSQCVDNYGGVSSTYLYSNVYTSQAGSWATTYGTETSFCGSTVYTSNAVCNVTMTSS